MTFNDKTRSLMATIHRLLVFQKFPQTLLYVLLFTILLYQTENQSVIVGSLCCDPKNGRVDLFLLDFGPGQLASPHNPYL